MLLVDDTIMAAKHAAARGYIAAATSVGNSEGAAMVVPWAMLRRRTWPGRLRSCFMRHAGCYPHTCIDHDHQRTSSIMVSRVAASATPHLHLERPIRPGRLTTDQCLPELLLPAQAAPQRARGW